jgi:hypothetical protein
MTDDLQRTNWRLYRPQYFVSHPYEVSLGFSAETSSLSSSLNARSCAPRRSFVTRCQMTSQDIELIGSPSDSVREIETQDGAVILDIRQGLCLSLTPVAATIWRLIRLSQSIDMITNCLAEEFPQAAKEQIGDDVVQFVRELKQKGLLQSNADLSHYTRTTKSTEVVRPRPHCINHPRQPDFMKQRGLFWKALLGLLAFDLFRFGKSFTRTYLFVRKWTIAPGLSPADTVEHVCRAVNCACVWYPKRVLCLQRSAITTCLLRSCGVDAQMVFGAQKVPFKAHAWTEVNGCVINERRDVRHAYLIWDRC